MISTQPRHNKDALLAFRIAWDLRHDRDPVIRRNARFIAREALGALRWGAIRSRTLH